LLLLALSPALIGIRSIGGLSLALVLNHRLPGGRAARSDTHHENQK